MKIRTLTLSIAVLLGLGCAWAQPTKVEVGKPLPAWSEGELDIHLINTGRGECIFHILPDGTTLIVDAGELPTGKISVAQRPNDATRPYITYARYIKHFMPEGKKAIDYCHLSHFHIDHLGSPKCATEKTATGLRKAGMLALYEEVPFNHVLDRAYPTYTEDDVTPSIAGKLAADWGKFVTWGVKEKRFTAERFAPGKEQIVLLSNPTKYKDFSIFNVCANGFVWGKNLLGEGAIIGGKSHRHGNPASCGFHLRYGAFDYLSCGDVSWTSQNTMAFYFRDYIGNGKLDAFKSNHHLAYNSWEVMLRAFNFDPRVVLHHCFASNKPHLETLARIEPFTEANFFTNIHPDIYAANKELIDKTTGYNGHIVLRVAPGGGEFYVYMLDDSDFEYRIKSIHGPYKSK